MEAQLILKGDLEEIKAILGTAQQTAVVAEPVFTKPEPVRVSGTTYQQTNISDVVEDDPLKELKDELDKLGVSYRPNSTKRTLQSKLKKAKEAIEDATVSAKAEVVSDMNYEEDVKAREEEQVEVVKAADAGTVTMEALIQVMQAALQKKISELTNITGKSSTDVLQDAVKYIRETFSKGKMKNDLDPSEYPEVYAALKQYLGE